MNTAQRIDLQDNSYLVYRSEYTLTFVKEEKKLFHIASEEKILAFKIICPPAQPVQKPMQQTMIIIIDQNMHWTIFGVRKQKQLSSKSIVQLATSKQFQSFGQTNSLTNKERSDLKCFINQYHLKGKLVVEVQTSLSSKLYLVSCRFNSLKDILFDLEITDQKNNYKQIWKNKKMVYSQTIQCKDQNNEKCQIVTKDGVLKNKQFFIKVICFQDQNKVYELFSFLVDEELKWYNGQMVITGMKQKPTGILWEKQKKQYLVLVIFPNNMTLLDINYDNQNISTKHYPIGGSIFVNKHPKQKYPRTLLCSGTSIIDLRIDHSNNTLQIKQLISNLPNYEIIIPYNTTSTQQYYAIRKDRTLESIKVYGGKVLSSEIIPSHSEKIMKVKHIRDDFSSILQLQKQDKVTNNKLKTEFYSNQPHLKIIGQYIHTIKNLKKSKIIYTYDTPLILITSQVLGTNFIEFIASSAGTISIVNSQIYKQFQTAQETIHFSKIHNFTFQATPSKLLVYESNILTKIPVSQIIQTDIMVDHCIRLGNTVLLAIHNQVHVFDFRNPKKPTRRFIYCFDKQIEYLGAGNTTNVAILKFYFSNVLSLYLMDEGKQAFVQIKQIIPLKDILVKETHTLPIKINTQNYCICFLVSNISPLLLVVSNDPYSKHHQKIIVQHSFLTFLTQKLIPVVTDSEKYTFLSQNIYLQFPKNIILEGDRKFNILCTKILNTFGKKIYYSQIIGKNICFRMYQNQIGIYQEQRGKFFTDKKNQNIIEGYKCEVQFEKFEQGNKMKIHAYARTTMKQSQFKGREIEKIKSQIFIPDKLPSQIANFLLPFEALYLKVLSSGIYILYNKQQIWLVRFLEKDKLMYLSVFSKFHYDNEEYLTLKNRLPPEDYQDQKFLEEFNKIYSFTQIQILLIEDSYCQLLIVYPGMVLILQVHNMVFKIQQVIKTQQQIQTILDSFESGKAYLRTKNTLLLMSKRDGVYELTLVKELDEDIVLATQVNNWESCSRVIDFDSKIPQIDSKSRILVKSFGQLEIETRDSKGIQTSKELYF